MIPVKSSNIQSLGWSDQTGLAVRFSGGSLYTYRDAPKKIFDDMLQAESVGAAFRDHVRGKYKHVQHDAKPHSG